MMKVIAILLLLCATAFADEKSAEKLFRAGEKAYKAQKFSIAAQNFDAAYKEFNAPEIAFSAAQAFRRAYRLDPTHTEYVTAAITYYQIYTTSPKVGTRAGDAADSLGEMQREAERLGLSQKARAPAVEKKTRLGVSVVFADRQQSIGMHEVDEDKDKSEKNAPTVKAFIDGKPQELDQLEDVKPGDHVVRAEADGYQPVEQPAHIVENDSRFAELILQPKPAHITVQAEQGSKIIVDGRGMGETPHAAVDLPGGTHVVTVVHTGRRPIAHEVVVTRDENLTVPFALKSTTRRKAVPYVIGVGGVTLLATGFFLFGANHEDNKAVQQQKLLMMGNQPDSVLDDYNRYRQRRDLALDLSYASAGTTVVVGLFAAWLYYFDMPSADGVKVVPFSTGGSSGAAILGRF